VDKIHSRCAELVHTIWIS